MTTSPVGMSTWEAESAGVFLRGGGGYAQWRIQGGGSRGSGPPLLCHDVGFLTLGPKLDPVWPPLFLLVDLIWTPPPFKNPGSAPDAWCTVASRGGQGGGVSAPGSGPVVGARAKLDFFVWIGSQWGIQDFDKGGAHLKKLIWLCMIWLWLYYTYTRTNTHTHTHTHTHNNCY